MSREVPPNDNIPGDDVPGDDVPREDDRSPLAKGFDLASRIIVAGAGFGLLAWGGYWLDARLGWNGPLLITGAAIGGISFFLQMMKLVQDINRRK